MPFDLERTTAFGVNAKEVIDLLQDPKRFMVASGGTEEESISYDESAGLWHAQSKDSIPMLAKPKYTAKMEKTSDGAKWTVETTLGSIKSVHTWTVEAIADQECRATEKTTVYSSALAYLAVKFSFPKTQERSHKSLQEYLS